MWKAEWTIALVPIAAAVLVSLLVVVFSGSASAGQWAAVITFFLTLPFAVGRLIDRAR